MTVQVNEKIDDLPPDNAARLAIYDALHMEADDGTAVSSDEFFDRVIGRLRILVPRELHLTGERAYVDEKVRACIDAGIISLSVSNGRSVLTLAGERPHLRYPDGEIREYSPGLELARERLDRDNARLRDACFDVREFLPTVADDPNGTDFQALLASMREHGYLKQFPLVKHHDDVVVDGRARQRAAAMLHLDVEYLKYGSDKDRTAARRRDTPLSRILVALHSNAGRLLDEVVEEVHTVVAKKTGREWVDTAIDLELTAAWRRSIPPSYTPIFEVRKLAYRPGENPKVQVTPDDKVMLRSLVEAAGLAGYKIRTQLSEYLPIEEARTANTGGRKAQFARAVDLITGIATMQSDRMNRKLKLDPEWGQIREWLVVTFPPAGK